MSTINAFFNSHVENGKDEASLSSSSSGEKNDGAMELESNAHMTSHQRQDLELMGDETVEGVEEALKELNEEIENQIHDMLKMAYLKALKKCPEIVMSAHHRLLFLRCEHYHIELAALRLVRYWGKRLELYGEDRAFKPIGGPSDRASLREDGGALELGLLQVLPDAYDSEGRGILLESPTALFRSAQTKRVKRSGILRSVWYVLHVALMEDVQLQERGVVFLVDGTTASMTQFDLTLVQMMMESLRGCIPIRVGAFHICRPPLWIGLVLPFFQSFMTPILRARLWIHVSTRFSSEGRKESILCTLAKHGIPSSSVPTVLGGTAKVDLRAWYTRQRDAVLAYHEGQKGKENEETNFGDDGDGHCESNTFQCERAASMTSTTTSGTGSSNS